MYKNPGRGGHGPLPLLPTPMNGNLVTRPSFRFDYGISRRPIRL